MNRPPVIEVEATFLPYEEGGRYQMPDIKAGRYMPHLVVQPPDIRTARMEGGFGAEDYLPVAFVDGPSPLAVGRSGRFVVELMNNPRLMYETLEPAASFTIREGAKVVGYGTVISRSGAADRNA